MTAYDNTSNQPDLVRIPTNESTTLQKNYIKEFSEITYPMVSMHLLNREETIVDELYLEAQTRSFKDGVDLRAFVEHKPEAKALGKFGIEASRDILFHVPTLYLAEAEMLPRSDNDHFFIGSLVKWGMDFYEIKDQHKQNDAYWANTNIPMFLTFSGDYYRHGH
jgi:hypothetical protein